MADLSRLQNCSTRCVGQSIFGGHGTGGKSAEAGVAAKTDEESIAAFLQDRRLVVVVTGLGGGAGSGITPEVLRLAYERNIPTLVFTVSPFSFEEDERRHLANRMRPSLEHRGVVVVHLDNDELAASAGADATLDEAREAASRKAAEGITFLWRLVDHPGYIGLDVADMASLLRTCRGRACFAYATASGENRVADAATALFAPGTGLLSDRLSKAPAVAVGILGGRDLRLHEVGDVMAALRSSVNPGCHLYLGTAQEPVPAGDLALAALVFECWNGASPARPDETPPPDRISRVFEKTPEPPAAAPSAPPAERPQPVASGRSRKSAAHAAPVATSRTKDHFLGTTPMIYNGESLDVPTYQRRGLAFHAG